jgi:prophage regulatory protein
MESEAKSKHANTTLANKSTPKTRTEVIENISNKRIIRLPKVLDKTGISRSGIYNKIRAGEFCKPVVIGPRSVGWIEEEVDLYIQSCIAQRDNNQVGGSL